MVMEYAVLPAPEQSVCKWKIEKDLRETIA